MSIKSKGSSLPEIIGDNLGYGAKMFMRVFSLLLMVLVGAVFMSQPAELIAFNVSLPILETPFFGGTSWELFVVLMIILLYYILATILPIDKIIGRFYPFFGIALLVMAVSILLVLLFKSDVYPIPELTSLENQIADPAKFPVVPMLFTTIACGALSGFHATQSPLMARCVTSETQARPIFFGAMIAESIIALIWAAVAMAFFGGVEGLNSWMAENGSDAGLAVSTISMTTLGVVGSILALLGVVAAPITSGDTAFRSARLIVADMLNIDQRPIWKRLAVSLPLFAAGVGIAFIDFDVIWRYFAWSNQGLSVLTLWMITAWLMHRRSRFVPIAMIPALIMTYICASFVFVSDQFIGMGGVDAAYIYGGAVTAIIAGLLIMKIRRDIKHESNI